MRRIGLAILLAASPAFAAAEGIYIRLEAKRDAASATEAARRWAETFPDIVTFPLDTGWTAIAAGPIEGGKEAAQKRADSLKATKTIPADAFIAELGADTEIARLSPDASEPEAVAEIVPEPEILDMPPLEDVQAILRWSGSYDGEIDGKTGPQTNAAISAAVEAQGIDPALPDAQARAIHALFEQRDAWRSELGVETLIDEASGLEILAPTKRLEFQRVDQGMSIYGPKDGSGAALILFNQEGGRQEMLDMAGLITALGWVPHPGRQIERESFILDGDNETHIGHAQGRVIDGRVQGFVLIWPQGDAENAPRLIDEIGPTLKQTPIAEPAETTEPAEAADSEN